MPGPRWDGANPTPGTSATASLRIGLDLRYLSHGLVGGIHTYLANLVPALLRVSRDDRFFFYVDTKEPFEIRQVPDRVTIRSVPYRGAWSSVYHDLFLGRVMAQDHLDVAHFPASYGFAPAGCPCIITLQDEINILPLREIWRGHAKRPRTLAMMTYLHMCTRSALPRADLVMTVSEYSKRQIVRHSPVPESSIVPIPHACPADITRVTDESRLAAVRHRLGLTRRVVLAEAFKNPAVLVRAWRRLPEAARHSAQIVFFSRSATVLPVVHEAVADGCATLLVRPARADLSALYSMADAFVFPSWIEGFGIPLLEAMTCGAPVIASDRGAIPEVVGSAGLLIDAEDDEGLARHLNHLLSEPIERERWRQRGLARAAEFSWDRIAGQVLSCYRSVVAGPRAGLGSP
jgi:glycosyltransferase involved in cell wall biosynthesis